MRNTRGGGNLGFWPFPPPFNYARAEIARAGVGSSSVDAYLRLGTPKFFIMNSYFKLLHIGAAAHVLVLC